jgi:multidrug/hemolysin transport system permease protein
MMGVILSLTRRNAKIYLRDKSSVFFSLLSVLIIIALYALFLAEIQVDSLRSMVGDIDGIRFLVDSWIMSGILIVNTVTVTLGVLGNMIDDDAHGRLNGFLVTPIKRRHIVWGYLLSSWFVGIAISLIAFVLSEVYIVVSGGSPLPGPAIIEVVGLIVVNVLSASSMLFFIMTFVRTVGGFGALSTILGTMIGFLTGIYMPVGILPKGVQTVIRCVPFSYSAALMRQIFTREPLSQVFAGVPEEAVREYILTFGIKMTIAGYEVKPLMTVAIVAGTGLIFFGLSALRMRLRRAK